MAHRKTGEKVRSDSQFPHNWDGLTKQLNPFNIGIDPGINVSATPPEMPGDAVSLPEDPRRKYSTVPKGGKRKERRAGIPKSA